MPNFKQSKGYKMKGFSGFKSSPAKQKQQSSGKDKVSEQQTSELGKKVKAQKAFKAWEKGSTGANQMLNKRADVLKTLKKVTKTKVPKGAKSIEAASNYEKDFAKIWNSDYLKAKRGQKDKINPKDLKGKSTKKVMEMLLKQGFTPTGKKKSPAKQEGPIDKKQMGLQKGEMEGTSVYSGKDKSERMIDLEDRIEFLSSDIEGGSDRPGQNMSDMKKARKRLQHELDIMMNRKGSGVKKSPGKMYGKKKK